LSKNKSKSGIKEEARIQKRIAKAEKRAKKYTGVDDGIVQRFWEIVNLFPKITTLELERRVENFIMKATPGQFFAMQQVLFEEAMPYLLGDERVRNVMKALSGKQIGLAVSDEYESTITLDELRLTVSRGISNKDIPVISVASRRDYADAVLQKKDPVKMILGKRIRATHKLKLLRWGLPHLDLVRDKGLLDKYLAYQDDVEQVLEEYLTKHGY
jgi:hypothetical protein